MRIQSSQSERKKRREAMEPQLEDSQINKEVDERRLSSNPGSTASSSSSDFGSTESSSNSLVDLTGKVVTGSERGQQKTFYSATTQIYDQVSPSKLPMSGVRLLPHEISHAAQLPPSHRSQCQFRQLRQFFCTIRT